MIDTLYDTFKHWSANGSVYIISDTHFEDEDCKLMDPLWISPQRQIEILKIAHKTDTLVVLGDVGNPEWFGQLKCHKVLVLGNHDAGKSVYLENGLFDEVYEGALFIADRILLSHEPVNGLPWCLNIHGHDHADANVDQVGHHLNLAANVCGYTPINLGREIKRGLLSGIENMHRSTIDNATRRKQIRKGANPNL